MKFPSTLATDINITSRAAARCTPHLSEHRGLRVEQTQNLPDQQQHHCTPALLLCSHCIIQFRSGRVLHLARDIQHHPSGRPSFRDLAQAERRGIGQASLLLPDCSPRRPELMATCVLAHSSRASVCPVPAAHPSHVWRFVERRDLSAAGCSRQHQTQHARTHARGRAAHTHIHQRRPTSMEIMMESHGACSWNMHQQW